MNSIPKKKRSKVALWPLPVPGSIDGFRDRQTFEPRVEEFWKQRWSHNWNTAWSNQALSQGRGRGRAAEEILNFKLYTHTIRWSWWSPRGRYSEQVWHPMSSFPHSSSITLIWTMFHLWLKVSKLHSLDKDAVILLWPSFPIKEMALKFCPVTKVPSSLLKKIPHHEQSRGQKPPVVTGNMDKILPCHSLFTCLLPPLVELVFQVFP